MVVVVREARESGQAAVVSFPLTFFLLPLLFPSADLVVQLGLPVYLMRWLPVDPTNGSEAEKGPPFSGEISRCPGSGQQLRRPRLVPGPDPPAPFMSVSPPPPSLWADVARPPPPPFINGQETAARCWQELLSVFPGAR